MNNSTSTPSTTPVSLLRMSQLRKVVGLSRASIYNLIKRGEFPAQRKLSANCVAWRADEVSEWIATRVSEPTDAVLRLLSKRQLNGNQLITA